MNDRGIELGDRRAPRGVLRRESALAYLGGLLLVAGVLAVFGRFGSLIAPWARLVLLGATTITLLGAGAWSREGVTAWRTGLAATLWLGSVATVALFVGVLFGEVIGADSGVTWLAMAMGAALFAASVWRLRPGALQQLAWFAALLYGLLAAVLLAEAADSMALIVWALGIAWMMFSWAGVITPTRTGYFLGGLAALVATQILDLQQWGLGTALYGAGLALGAATSAGLLVAGVAVRAPVLVGLGIAGAVAFLGQAGFRFFAGTADIPPSVLLIAGLLLIAFSAVLAILLRRRIGQPVDRLERRRVSTAAGLVVLVFLTVAAMAPSSMRRAEVHHAFVSPDGFTIVLGVLVCNATLRETITETPTTVEVAVYARGSAGDCQDLLAINLEAPLGDRALIDLYDGEPIDSEFGS